MDVSGRECWVDVDDASGGEEIDVIFRHEWSEVEAIGAEVFGPCEIAVFQVEFGEVGSSGGAFA